MQNIAKLEDMKARKEGGSMGYGTSLEIRRIKRAMINFQKSYDYYRKKCIDLDVKMVNMKQKLNRVTANGIYI